MHDFVRYNNAQAVEDAISIFEKASGEELYAGDERVMLINTFGYMLDVVMAEINYRANNCVIALCDEETLYMRAADRCVERIESKESKVVMRFSMDEAIGENITIPAGTRVTHNGEVFFETLEETTIEAGNTSVEIECRSTEDGERMNGIGEGKINILVDTIPYITNVTNISISEGGRDQEDLEAFRQRVINAPKGFSTAGAELAYIAKVKEVDNTVVDVKPIYDENNKTLNIYVLCENGKQPSSELITKIRAYIYQKHIKASTDKVEIKAAIEKKYTISTSYKIDSMDQERESIIKERVKKAVDGYLNAMQSEMGLKLNPEMLKKVMYNAGAATVSVTSPEQTALKENEYAVCESTTITYLGLI